MSLGAAVRSIQDRPAFRCATPSVLAQTRLVEMRIGRLRGDANGSAAAGRRVELDGPAGSVHVTTFIASEQGRGRQAAERDGGNVMQRPNKNVVTRLAGLVLAATLAIIS